MSSELDRFDRQLIELRKLKFDKRECPACRGLLETPVPLKPMVCPVCRLGKLTKRKIDERWCPICRSGALKSVNNKSPIKFCPMCQSGRLRSSGILRKSLTCEECAAALARRGNELTLRDPGRKPKAEIAVGTQGDSDEYWLPLTTRSERVVFCETCKAHWDESEDGSMQLFKFQEDPFGVARRYRDLKNAEWARVGVRLKPEGGNVACAKCDADFMVDGEDVIPLSVDHDPYGFMADYKGCRLTFESIRFLGVYKTSGRIGPVCAECRTEFDAEGDYLRLRATTNSNLLNYIDQARPFEDWQRVARGLPAIDEESHWHEQYDDALRRALLTGEIPWADRKRKELLWRSEAELVAHGARGRLLLSEAGIEFQSKRHGWSAPFDVVRGLSVDEGVVTLDVVGQPEPLAFRIEPETVAVDLASGKRQVVLEAEDFAAALRHLA